MTPHTILIHAASTDMMAEHINEYVLDNDIQHIHDLGNLLTQQRKSTPQDYVWEELLQNLKAKVKICACICSQHKKSVALLNEVMCIAHHMQPGENHTSSLIHRIEQKQATYEEPELHDTNWEF